MPASAMATKQSVCNEPEYTSANDASIRVAIIDVHPMLCAGVADSFSSEPGF